MKEQYQAFVAELIKLRRAPIVIISFLAMSLAPVFGGVFMLLMKNGGESALSGAFKAKATLLDFEAEWSSMLSLLQQAVSIGGIVIFGFIVSWLFGREYAEGTFKDMLSLPMSRTKIVNAKLFIYAIWSLMIAGYNLLLGMLISTALQLPGWEFVQLGSFLPSYFFAVIMVIISNILIAFVALRGSGYLAPLGVVFLLIIVSQIMGALGFGIYFPWAIPGIYSGIGGDDLKNALNSWSYVTIGLAGVIGYAGTVMYMVKSDHKK